MLVLLVLYACSIELMEFYLILYELLDQVKENKKQNNTIKVINA